MLYLSFLYNFFTYIWTFHYADRSICKTPWRFLIPIIIPPTRNGDSTKSAFYAVRPSAGKQTNFPPVGRVGCARRGCKKWRHAPWRWKERWEAGVSLSLALLSSSTWTDRRCWPKSTPYPFSLNSNFILQASFSQTSNTLWRKYTKAKHLCSLFTYSILVTEKNRLLVSIQAKIVPENCA